MNILDKLKPRATPSETARIIGLPAREPPDLSAYAGPDLTPELTLGVSDWSLRPVQSWALEEIRVNRGAVLAVGVGHGKTLIAYATPTVLGVDPADVLVLVPANLRDTFRREGLKYAAHFRTPPELPMLSYAELSRPAALDYLERTRPKVIVCDEAHYLRAADATRTRRFMRYLKDATNTVLVAMSGTLFTSSIKDGQPLIIRALGDGAPVPSAYSTLEWWAACIDVPRGAECNPTTDDYRRIAPLVDRFGRGDLMSLTWTERKAAVREAFHKRFVTTPGVVHTVESSAANGLFVQPIRPAPGPMLDVAPLIDEVESSWTRPDGELLEDELRVNECLRMLALGYYYTWDWGAGGEDVEWNEARLEYGRRVAAFLRRDRPGIDSPYLVEQAVRRTLLEAADVDIPDGFGGPTLNVVQYADLIAAFRAWDPIRDRATPTPRGVVEATGIIGSVVRYAQRVVKERGTRGIVWYAHDAAATILEGLGVHVYRPGEDPEADPNPAGTVAGMSIASHGTGKNLQSWSDNFVLYPPANGKTWEQLVGRTHRPGQSADDVWVYVLDHTPEHAQALRNAQEQAVFAETVQGQRQKLNIATWLTPLQLS